MALTNEEKVEVLKDAAIRYFQNNLNTLPEWIAFVNNVTKTQVKNFLKNAIDQASTDYSTSSSSLADKASGYTDLSNQIDTL